MGSSPSARHPPPLCPASPAALDALMLRYAGRAEGAGVGEISFDDFYRSRPPARLVLTPHAVRRIKTVMRERETPGPSVVFLRLPPLGGCAGTWPRPTSRTTRGRAARAASSRSPTVAAHTAPCGRRRPSHPGWRRRATPSPRSATSSRQRPTATTVRGAPPRAGALRAALPRSPRGGACPASHSTLRGKPTRRTLARPSRPRRPPWGG